MTMSPLAIHGSATERGRSSEGLGVWIGRALAVILLLLILPVAAFAALLVRLGLGRPILFRQTRSGRGNRPLVVWKLRTMRETTGPDGELLPDDMRLTPLMKVLRRLRFDEIPQLAAIAVGDMAFVGPRPLLPETIAGFGEAGLSRCSVRPGLTGWAQVNGNTCLDDRQKLALDLWYVAHRSPWLDTRILVATLWVILRGERVNRLHLKRAMDGPAAPEGAWSGGASS